MFGWASAPDAPSDAVIRTAIRTAKTRIILATSFCCARWRSSERPVLTAEPRLNLLHQVQSALIRAANQMTLRSRFKNGPLGLAVPAHQSLALYTSSANKTPAGNSRRSGLRFTASIAARDAYRSLDNPSERSTTVYFIRLVL